MIDWDAVNRRELLCTTSLSTSELEQSTDGSYIVPRPQSIHQTNNRTLNKRHEVQTKMRKGVRRRGVPPFCTSPLGRPSPSFCPSSFSFPREDDAAMTGIRVILLLLVLFGAAVLVSGVAGPKWCVGGRRRAVRKDVLTG